MKLLLSLLLSLQAFLMAATFLMEEAVAFVPFVINVKQQLKQQQKQASMMMTTTPIELSPYIVTDEESEESKMDAANMRLAIQMAQSAYVMLT
jgi:hypothetical protein